MLWADAEQLNIIWTTMNWYMKPLAMSAKNYPDIRIEI